MSKKIILLSVIISISLVNASHASESLGYKQGELLVRFAPKPDGKQRTITERNQILAAIDGGTIIRSSKFVPGLSVVKLPENITVENALVLFKDANGILHAQPNYIYRTLSTFPNDPIFNQQWALHNTGQTGGTSDADIDGPEAWGIHTGSTEIIVAVIDTGVDYMHPDLNDNMWVNPGEIPDNDIDDDENGHVDDIYGYDFCNNDGNPMDDGKHGTACAGIVGAVGDNNEGVVGVCWSVKIMALKFMDSDGYGDTADAVDAIYYAIKMGANVLSNSWGGGQVDPWLRIAIEDADANGLLFVAASGNEDANHPSYPARYPKAIAVGATDHNDVRCDYSNYGDELDVMAPSSDKAEKGVRGGLIFWTTDISGSAGYNHGDVDDGDAAGNYTKWFGGTSASCPHVAGLAALSGQFFDKRNT